MSWGKLDGPVEFLRAEFNCTFQWLVIIVVSTEVLFDPLFNFFFS